MSDLNVSFTPRGQILRLILKAAGMQILKKAVFSKSDDKGIQKCVLTEKLISSSAVLQAEFFTVDNKARQENIPLDGERRLSEIVDIFSQINLITTAGECEYKRSKSGNETIIGGDKLERVLSAENTEFKKIEVAGNNRQKKHILNGHEPFLVLLGVSDKNGRVYDKKQAKFRQINRFLELIRDVEDKLPKDGVLRICDLCCGKSYLSFAVYHYFAVIKQRRVRMTGVDLKSDVIEYCSDVAKKLGFDGLDFVYGDIRLYDTEEHVNLVISLHACDTATDIVLDKAMLWEADVILSTPCCHHEMNRILDCPTLSFISDHSMLRQKLCDAATDALRLKLLEANGYDTMALELIDPDETPKNIMLRGVRRKNFDKNSEKATRAMQEYKTAYKFLTGTDVGGATPDTPA